MNILVISVDAFPKMGGVSTMAHQMCSSFTNLKHKVFFLGPKGTYIPQDYSNNYFLIEDFESNTKYREGQNYLLETKRIHSLISKIIKEYEINYIINIHPFYYGAGAILAAKETNIKIATYFHGFEFRSQLLSADPDHVVNYKDSIETLLDITLYNAKNSDIILTNSNFTKNQVATVRSPNDIYVTGCGVDQHIITDEILKRGILSYSQKSSFRNKSKINDKKTITYIGRIVHNKRVDRLLLLISKLSGFQAIIIGEGPEKEALERAANEMDISDRVLFKGKVSEKEKFNILRCSDFIALLSEQNENTGHVEGFGIALIEGAACSAVPITSGTGGMVDIVRNNDTGITIRDFENEELLKILEIANSDSLQNKICKQLHKDILEHHSWKNVCLKTLKFGGFSEHVI